MKNTYRTDKNTLITTLKEWDRLMPGRGKVHLIACGGTALTLLGHKESTADVDFTVPDEKEYDRLIVFLKSAGYEPRTGSGWMRAGERVIYDLFKGNYVYTTGLLQSPLSPGGNKKILDLKKIYLGVLNPTDLIITKMFRGHQVDIEDCITLITNESVDIEELKNRYRETAAYDTYPEKVLNNLKLLIKQLNGGD